MEPLQTLAAMTSASPGLPPWITTGVYLWLAMHCAWAWWESRATGKLGPAVWLVLAVLFAVLGVAKPFGAQWILADAFRQRAVREDWYEARRRFQVQVILGAAGAAALATAVITAVAIRRKSVRTLAAFAPVAMLLGFLAARATSLHQVDAVLYRKVAGVEINTLAELAILGVVAAGLVWRASGGSQRAPSVAAVSDDATGARRYSIR